MKKWTTAVTLSLCAVLLMGADGCDSAREQEERAVNRQQEQYLIGQPIPAFDWSLERHLVTELYKIRNQEVATHSVWRSDRGLVEGDCPSMGYGIPYDTSLTNPLQRTYSGAVVNQAEPNGIFASQNTQATWVMCVGAAGLIEPHYVETKVTVYPYPVSVDYAESRVMKAGEASVTVSSSFNQ